MHTSFHINVDVCTCVSSEVDNLGRGECAVWVPDLDFLLRDNVLRQGVPVGATLGVTDLQQGLARCRWWCRGLGEDNRAEGPSFHVWSVLVEGLQSRGHASW